MSASSSPIPIEADSAVAASRLSATAPEDRVPLHEKLALGIGGLTEFFGNVSVKAIAVPVYQMTLGVNPALLGLVLAIPRFWDAVTDPVMGNISDNFHSRF